MYIGSLYLDDMVLGSGELVVLLLQVCSERIVGHRYVRHLVWRARTWDFSLVLMMVCRLRNFLSSVDFTFGIFFWIP